MVAVSSGACGTRIVTVCARTRASSQTGTMTVAGNSDGTRCHWRVMTEEVIAMVAVVDAEHPCTPSPRNRTIEVRTCHIEVVLSRCEDTHETAVADAPS